MFKIAPNVPNDNYDEAAIANIRKRWAEEEEPVEYEIVVDEAPLPQIASGKVEITKENKRLLGMTLLSMVNTIRM